MSPSNYLEAISAPKIDDKVLGEKLTQQHKAKVADDWDEMTDSEESEVEIMQEEGLRRQVTVN